MTPKQTLSLAQVVPYMLGFPASRFWVDYDQDADVLYISFTRPQQATDTAMTDEGLLLCYRDDHIVGVTVLVASSRLSERVQRLKLM